MISTIERKFVQKPDEYTSNQYSLRGTKPTIIHPAVPLAENTRTSWVQTEAPNPSFLFVLGDDQFKDACSHLVESVFVSAQLPHLKLSISYGNKPSGSDQSCCWFSPLPMELLHSSDTILSKFCELRKT